MPDEKPEFSHILRLNRLRRDGPHQLEVIPTDTERAALLELLGLIGLRKMRFTATLAPLDREGWTLDGTVGATVTQPCVATMEPVQTRLDVPVRRTYLPDVAEFALSEELEITADTSDELEPLGTGLIDLGVLATGELALALPSYPRAAGAPEPEDAPAVDTDETHRPFAGLADLKAKLEKDAGKT